MQQRSESWRGEKERGGGRFWNALDEENRTNRMILKLKRKSAITLAFFFTLLYIFNPYDIDILRNFLYFNVMFTLEDNLELL